MIQGDRARDWVHRKLSDQASLIIPHHKGSHNKGSVKVQEPLEVEA